MSPVHMHLLLNHVPVVGILFVILVLAAALRKGNSDIARLGLLMMVVIAAVSAAVYFTGEPAEEAVEAIAGVSETAIHDHEEAAEVAFIATLVAGVAALSLLWLYRRRELPHWAPGTALVMALLVTGLMTWTANLGGQIRHSEIRSAATASEVTGNDDER